MTDRASSPADATPVDKSIEPPIRDEMRRLGGEIEQLRRALGPQLDVIVERLLHQMRLDREEDRKQIEAIKAEIVASENRAIAHTDALGTRIDARIDELSLRIGASLSESAEEVTQVTRLAKNTQAEVRVFTRGRVGFGLGGTAIALAAKSEISWAGVKLWAWSHGLLLTVVVSLALVALGVELITRLRARKGTSP